jgi:DinB superfamily
MAVTTMPMTPEKRKELIDLYKDGYRVVAEAVSGRSDEELDARPAPGKWTAREIVHHLADSEMTSAIRLRLLIATSNPQIVGYDQDEFAQKLYYDDRPVEASLDAFNAARRTTAEILDRLTPVQWLREGTHTEHGPYTVERWLEIYATHAHKHAEQIYVAINSLKDKK